MCVLIDVTHIPGVLRAGDFDASIDLPGDGTVTISAADFSQTFHINWSDKRNYFKAGAYVQSGNPSNFLVDYKSLDYSLDSGANTL